MPGHTSCPSCGAGINGETKTCDSCGKVCLFPLHFTGIFSGLGLGVQVDDADCWWDLDLPCLGDHTWFRWDGLR